jgi:hypothetical protein
MREEDLAAAADWEAALDKKEALVSRLAAMNENAAAHRDPGSGQLSESFQMDVTKVVLQLKELNADADKHAGAATARAEQVC